MTGRFIILNFERPPARLKKQLKQKALNSEIKILQSLRKIKKFAHLKLYVLI